MFVICPLGQITRNLCANAKFFLAYIDIDEIPMEYCHLLTRAMLDDVLNQRLHWAHDTNLTMEVVLSVQWPEKVVHCDKTKENYSVPLFFYDNLLVDFQNQISEWLDTYIPGHTWDIWHTKPMGEDVLLEKGIDWRIADWHRMKREQQGE